MCIAQNTCVCSCADGGVEGSFECGGDDACGHIKLSLDDGCVSGNSFYMAVGVCTKDVQGGIYYSVYCDMNDTNYYFELQYFDDSYIYDNGLLPQCNDALYSDKFCACAR